MSRKYVLTDIELEELFHSYCRDYTALAKAGKFDPISGRDKEIEESILILLQKTRKNVVLLAPAGVGKTALVVGLAQKIAEGKVPDYLKNARLMEIDLPSMAAGTDSSAEFQGRFVPLCRGVAERDDNPDYPKVILFIDEMHTIMSGVKGSAYAGLAEVMKPYLTTGSLHIIGATTLDEYRWYVREDAALDRRFQKVFLKVPDQKETLIILDTLRPNYMKYHRTGISDRQLELIIRLTDEHMRHRNQPDKSIITMDAAMAHHVMMHGYDKDLDDWSIYYMLGRETGLNARALMDDRREIDPSAPRRIEDDES